MRSPAVLSPGRVRAARILAVAADLAQIALLPAVFPLSITPINNVIDVAVGLALVALVGWHWALLPAFVAEMIPLVEVVPTWTVAVFIATRGRAAPPGGRVEPGPPPPPLAQVPRGPSGS